MNKYEFSQFGLEHLGPRTVEAPAPGPGEVLLDIKALSLNYRDLLVVTGGYNPRLKLPATPVSDGAGMVAAVGEGVTGVLPGDRVMSHFVSGWIDGPFRGEYVGTTLGVPGAGLAAEQVVLPAEAVVPVPERYDFAEASTLPIAALTAWNALVVEGRLQPGQTVLTLGTGGVSIFALQLARAMGVRVIVTSSSDEKLERAAALGADHTLNYIREPKWEKEVLSLTDRVGVDVVVENGGIGTLGQSLRATKAGGTVAMLGALTGLQGEVNIAPLVMNRLHVVGILVGSREAFMDMRRFIESSDIKPVISDRFAFDALPEAFRHMQDGKHFGKIVVEV